MKYYGYTYKVTDLLNTHNLPNPVYVGKKKGKFKSTYYGSGIYIKPVVEKYGKENFKVEPIAYAFSKDELSNQERFWIKETNCLWPKGYNLSTGGEGGNGGLSGSRNGMFGRDRSKEKNPMFGTHRAWVYNPISYERIAIINPTADVIQDYLDRGWIRKSGVKFSPEALLKVRRPKTEDHRRNLSIAKTGTKLSEQHKKNIGIGCKGIKHSKEHIEKIGIANSIPVLQYDKNGIFIKEYNSFTKAEGETNIAQESICRCASGKAKTAGGFIWRKK